MTIIDDRTMLDERLGCRLRHGGRCMMDVIDGYLDDAPGVPHPARRTTCPSFATGSALEAVPGIPHGTRLACRRQARRRPGLTPADGCAPLGASSGTSRVRCPRGAPSIPVGDRFVESADGGPDHARRFPGPGPRGQPELLLPGPRRGGEHRAARGGGAPASCRAWPTASRSSASTTAARTARAAIADRLAAEHPMWCGSSITASNQGYGAALRSGLGAARYPLVCFTDGDRQFRIADLGRLLERIANSRPSRSSSARAGRGRGLPHQARRPAHPAGLRAGLSGLPAGLLRPPRARRGLRLQALPARGAGGHPARHPAVRSCPRSCSSSCAPGAGPWSRWACPTIRGRRDGRRAPTRAWCCAPSATSGGSGCCCGLGRGRRCALASRSCGRRTGHGARRRRAEPRDAPVRRAWCLAVGAAAQVDLQ